MTTPDPRPNDTESSDSSSRKPLPARRPERPPSGNLLWYLMIGVVLAALVFSFGSRGRRGETLTAQVFLQQLQAGELNSANVYELKFSPEKLTFQNTPATVAGQTASAKSQTKTFTVWLLGLSDKTRADIEAALQKQSISGWGGGPPDTDYSPYISFVLLLALTLGVFLFVLRRIGGPGAAMSFGRSRGKMYAQEDLGVTFNDVAGIDEAVEELREIVEFLRTPAKYQALGGRIPHGVLLVGPPGTGKTLLAKAVAGEAGVPFFGLSGSDFVELFVGVGASRVRDLFAQAVQRAPSIIFIDELDAIGRSRGGPVVMGGHDEREQTLNQLLTELDGFDTSVGVVVMAATNRPEVLDKALLRAGRFDRQIIVDKPDLQDRIEILKLHTQKMTLAQNVDIAVIAKRTPGLVGADLANIANEAAIIATRGEHNQIEMADFEYAIDRILAGPEKKNRVLNPDEKRRVAYHEAGHAMVAEHVPTGQPVHKISIIPRGVSALGFTLQLPVEEKFLSTEDELKDQIAILLGGRMAEEIVLGSISTGAQNDLEKASDIARNMVCSLGMSKKLGPLTYGKRQQLQFLESEVSEYRNYSDETARLIDTEVITLVQEGESRARKIISSNRDALEKLANLLQEKEVINREEMVALLGL